MQSLEYYMTPFPWKRRELKLREDIRKLGKANIQANRKVVQLEMEIEEIQTSRIEPIAEMWANGADICAELTEVPSVQFDCEDIHAQVRLHFQAVRVMKMGRREYLGDIKNQVVRQLSAHVSDLLVQRLGEQFTAAFGRKERDA